MCERVWRQRRPYSCPKPLLSLARPTRNKQVEIPTKVCFAEGCSQLDQKNQIEYWRLIAQCSHPAVQRLAVKGTKAIEHVVYLKQNLNEMAAVARFCAKKSYSKIRVSNESWVIVGSVGGAKAPPDPPPRGQGLGPWTPLARKRALPERRGNMKPEWRGT